MKTIAITGATGFVGGRLARHFLAKGDRVIGFGRRESNLPPEVDYRRWDISSGIYPLDVAVDVVIHCAASVTDWGKYPDLYRENVTGTVNVLDTFQDARQFIHLSTASVYDPFKPKQNIAEDATYPVKYLNAYASTKMLAEVAVRESHNCNRVILRPHIIYGPGDTTLLPRLLRARRFGRFFVAGKGQNHLSLTYIENLCQLVELVMAHEFDFEIFNVSDVRTETLNIILECFLDSLGFPEKPLHLPVTLAEAAATLSETLYRVLPLKATPLLTRYAVPQMVSEYTLDISKAQRMLGYNPCYDFEDGFRVIKANLESRSES
jgi:nucleoside-diphosphate-sugar epimerase